MIRKGSLNLLYFWAAILIAAAGPFGEYAQSESLSSPDTSVSVRTIKLFNPDSVVEAKTPSSYDQGVLQPLHEAQALAAKKAEEERVAAEVAEEAAYQNWARSIADRVKPPGTYENGYVPLNCTALVASMIKLPSDHLGDADQWASSLSHYGWTVSDIPLVGAIAQSSAGYYGHVGVVMGIEKGHVMVIEENAQGLGVIDTTSYPISHFVYIY